MGSNLQHTIGALQKHGVGEPEAAEFLALFTRYKDEIVETTGSTGPGSASIG